MRMGLWGGYKDLFLYAGKQRHGVYFGRAFRAGVSAFHVSPGQQALTDGPDRLKADIDPGKILDVIGQYENDGGDYLFMAGEKR